MTVSVQKSQWLKYLYCILNNPIVTYFSPKWVKLEIFKKKFVPTGLSRLHKITGRKFDSPHWMKIG